MARAKAQLGMSGALFDLFNGDGTALSEAAAVGAKAAARYWHAEIMPEHFLPSARGKYPGVYTDVTRGYAKRKARIRHHQKPMVWSGVMRETLRSGASIQQTKQKRKVVTVLRTPHARALNLWKNGRKHDFQKQITAQNAHDFARQAAVVELVTQAEVARRLRSNAVQVVSTHVV